MSLKPTYNQFPIYEPTPYKSYIHPQPVYHQHPTHKPLQQREPTIRLADLAPCHIPYEWPYKWPLQERWGAGVETQKNVRGEIGGWGRVPFNETYAPSLRTIYDGA